MTGEQREEVITLYSPKIAEPFVRKLYRLARVRSIPMTKLVAEIIEEYLATQECAIATYDPAIHDRPQAA